MWQKVWLIVNVEWFHQTLLGNQAQLNKSNCDVISDFPGWNEGF